MALQDCVVATSTETIDPTMVVPNVVIKPDSVLSPTALLAAISASWDAITNPYVQGIVFDYGPTDGSSGRSITAVQRQSPLTWTDGVVGGQDYTVRYRAAGIPPIFGLWSSYVTISVPAPIGIPPPEPNSPVWHAEPTTIGSPGYPAIHLFGALDLLQGVTAIRFEVTPHGTDGWTVVKDAPIDTTDIDITAVGANAYYDAAISYVNYGAVGPRRVYNHAGPGYLIGGGPGTGGAGVTPTTITWPNVTASGAGAQTGTMTAQSILGISAPITLSLTYTGATTWTYTKNGMVAPFSSGATVVVSNNDTLGFDPSADSTTSGTLTVTNLTDSGAVLGTPTYSLTVTGTDVTPNALAWSDFSDDGFPPYGASGGDSPQTFSGINVAINLSLTFTGSGALSYRHNGAPPVPFSSGDTLMVAPGDTLFFTGHRSTTGTSFGVLTVTNLSDSSTVLGTINYRLTVSPGFPP